MDDTDTLTITVDNHTYTATPPTEGQLLALILCRDLDTRDALGILTDVLKEAVGSAQWTQFLRRLALGEHTGKAFMTMAQGLVPGDGDDAPAPGVQ